MSYFDYKESQQIASHDFSFYGLLMAAMRKADTYNTRMFKLAWPDVWDELHDRYNAPGGILPDDSPLVPLEEEESNETP